jgi:16S rRNA processing protein RimM
MDKVVVGKIRTSHGVKGDLKVTSFSEEYDHFHDFEWVILSNGKRELKFEVEDVKGSGTGTLLKLKGIDNPEDGKLYAGYEIIVDRKFASKCLEDEYYQTDLVDCKLMHNKILMGSVISVLNGGPKDLLEVKLLDERVVLVPFGEEFIGDVNISKKEIELKVDWILE